MEEAEEEAKGRVERAKEQISRVWREEQEAVKESYEERMKTMVEEHQQKLSEVAQKGRPVMRAVERPKPTPPVTSVSSAAGNKPDERSKERLEEIIRERNKKLEETRDILNKKNQKIGTIQGNY
eukprot:TRINITY_DN9225_c0_g1_i1.p1 TRINITY_DN9225_c0_g1~~TRINITY_DN9225_c0_g1_i1.p1  ORF type:complete len:132 (-),score=45.27 TRINITY_DN9225_c0_g1_i1:435-806(-)